MTYITNCIPVWVVGVVVLAVGAGAWWLTRRRALRVLDAAVDVAVKLARDSATADLLLAQKQVDQAVAELNGIRLLVFDQHGVVEEPTTEEAAVEAVPAARLAEDVEAEESHRPPTADRGVVWPPYDSGGAYPEQPGFCLPVDGERGPS